MSEPDAGSPTARRGGWWQRVRSDLDELYNLPPRVQALVDAEMQRADILGAWIGLVVAGFLGSLYLLSPKALDAIDTFQPVPSVVGVFLLVSLVRLRLAYRAPLSRLAQTLFILMDVTLLYILIWSFHIQYEQPPAFYLKAPTFLFIFLLIAVRTLRFEPLAVVIIGLTSAVGWALMTVYAIHETPEPALTRDFTAYITGNLVLVGAEVEKIVAVLLVTLVLSLAIMQGRRSLVRAVRGTTARDDLARFFAPEVAASITGRDDFLKPGFGEMRQGAVLVSDIRGFTGLAARRRPSELVNLLIAYQRRMGPIIKQHHGVIDKFLGDGILATFGCAMASNAPTADALRALVALRRAADAFSADMSRRLGEPIELGFALVGGEVLCGTVGDEERLEFTVIGEVVNRAVKLEKANKVLGTGAVVDARTFEAAVQEGFTEELNELAEHQVDLQDGFGARLVLGWRRSARA
jgi:adenylate cyclase